MGANTVDMKKIRSEPDDLEGRRQFLVCSGGDDQAMAVARISCDDIGSMDEVNSNA